MVVWQFHWFSPPSFITPFSTKNYGKMEKRKVVLTWIFLPQELSIRAVRQGSLRIFTHDLIPRYRNRNCSEAKQHMTTIIAIMKLWNQEITDHVLFQPIRGTKRKGPHVIDHTGSLGFSLWLPRQKAHHMSCTETSLLLRIFLKQCSPKMWLPLMTFSDFSFCWLSLKPSSFSLPTFSSPSFLWALSTFPKLVPNLQSAYCLLALPSWPCLTKDSSARIPCSLCVATQNVIRELLYWREQQRRIAGWGMLMTSYWEMSRILSTTVLTPHPSSVSLIL